MAGIESITFWTNLPSIHQEGWMRALARDGDVRVHVIADEHLTEDRRKLGWRVAEFAPARLTVGPTEKERARHVEAHSGEGHVHLFSGTYAYPGVRRTLRHVAASRDRRGTKVLVLAEAGRRERSVAGVGRWLLHASEARRWDGRIDALLAYGDLGVAWYRAVGYSATPVLPVAYFQDALDDGADEGADDLDALDDATSTELAFVGQLVPRKGLDVVLHALQRLHVTGVSVRLRVIGDGADRAALHALAVRLGVEGAVEWLGALPSDDVRRTMRRARSLVVPSRFDGWGAVVTEALHEGVHVLASPHVGAGVLLDDPVRGAVVHRNDVASWTDAIASLVHVPSGASARGERRMWARRHVGGEAGAAYLRAVVAALGDARGSRNVTFPPPPWISSSDEEASHRA